MWTYILGQFWVFPQGVGFGTPLLGDDMGAFFGWGTGDFEEMQFALGAHNSFITLLGRLGVVAIVFFFLIGRPFFLCLRQFLQRTKRFSRWDSEFCFVFGSLVVLLIAFVHAFFNMMIETPLYAAHFWFPFGLFIRLCGDYAAKHEERNQAVV